MIDIAYMDPKLVYDKARELTSSARVISLDSYFDGREDGMCGLSMPKVTFDIYHEIMVPDHSFAIVTDGDNYGFVGQIVTKPIFKREDDVTEDRVVGKSEKKDDEKGLVSKILSAGKSLIIPNSKSKIITPYNRTYTIECTHESTYSGKDIMFSSEETDRFGFLINLGSEELNTILLQKLRSTKCGLKRWGEYANQIEGLQDYCFSGDQDYQITREGHPFLNLANADEDLLKILEKSATFRFIDGGEDAFYTRMIEFGSRLKTAINGVIGSKREEMDGYQIFKFNEPTLSDETDEPQKKVLYSLANFKGDHFLLPTSSEPIGEVAKAPTVPKVKAGVLFKPSSEQHEREVVVSSPFNVNIKKSGDGLFGYTPRDLKKFLDEYVIGQETAKKRIAVAAFEHMTRIHDALSDRESKKSNILMMGDTGTGKTHIAKTLAKALELPFVEIDCNTLTEHGYEGSNIEDALVKLYNHSGKNQDVAQRGIVFLDEFDKLRRQGGGGRDVRGNVQNALLKIVEGDTVDLTKYGCKVQLDTSNILFICGGAFAESGENPGLDQIVGERVSPEERIKLGFDTHKNVPTGPKIDMEKVYQHATDDDIIDFGIIPELVGRLASFVALDRLNPETLKRILTEPKDSIIADQVSFFKTHGVELEFEGSALDLIAERAYQTGTGARSLKKIIEQFMLDLKYDIQDYQGQKLVIDSDKIKELLN